MNRIDVHLIVSILILLIVALMLFGVGVTPGKVW